MVIGEGLNLELVFEKASMPSSRPADYIVSCFDGSIFMDFDIEEGLVHISRISFDGYGCCNIGSRAHRMSKDDSIGFKAFFSSTPIGNAEFTDIVLRTIRLNVEYIWRDALEEYRLI